MENLQEKNDKSFIEHYEKLLERTDKEIERVHKFYKLAAILLTTIVSVGFTIGSILFFTNLKEMKESATNEVNQLKESVNKKVNFLADSITYDLKNTVYKVEKDVKSKIEEEFDKENITYLVQNTAQERIDLVADQLVNKQIEERIMPELKSSKDKIDNLVQRTNTDILELEFKLTELAAINDDRKAFDKLVRWSHEPDYPFSKKAGEIRDKLINMNVMTSMWTYIGGWVLDFGKLNLNEIRELYKNAVRDFKTELIEETWKSNKFSEKERVEFQIDVIKNDNSLYCVAIAADNVIQHFNIGCKPLEIEKVLKWWDGYKN